MPKVLGNPDDHLLATILSHEARLRALETQQQLIITDPAGKTRVQVGLLPNGDYGIAVFDAATGDYEVVAYEYFACITASESTTSTTPTDLTTPGPSVTVPVGASGAVEVTMAACIDVSSGSSAAGIAYLFVDGVGAANLPNITVGNVNGVLANVSLLVRVSGLSEGDHVFEMKYESADGSIVTFANRTLSVRPI